MTVVLTPPPAGHLRLSIQDYADAPDRPALRTKDIPVGQGFVIPQEEIVTASKRVRRAVKKHGGSLALVFAVAIARKLGLDHGLTEQQLPFVMGAITSAVCSSWKTEIGKGSHNFTTSTGHSVKCALYTSSATLGASTTAYAGTNEVANGSGYTTGGVVMANVTPTLSSTTAIYDWADAVWTTSTFTANGCLVYNDTTSDLAIFVIAFGGDQTVTSGTFTIQWPTADASNAIIRIA